MKKPDLFFTNYLTSERGVAAVEFSMIAPILILLMVGIMDMGMYVRDQMKLEQISRASVDYVLNGGLDENIGTEVLDYYDPEHASDYTITTERVCTCSDGAAQECGAVTCEFGDYSRQYVQVSIDRNFSTLFPYPGIPDELTLHGYSRMRLD